MMKLLTVRLVTCAVGLLAIGSPALAQGKIYDQKAGDSGYDVSYPQCNSKLPTSHAFGIVGVNNGSANSLNPCLASELAWAEASTGNTSQPKAAEYANTGNPGDITPAVGDWPNASDPIIDPYGVCTGQNDAACSWEYGYQRAYGDVAESPSTTSLWWLDVETSNSWSTNLSDNRADLEGMVYAFTISGSRVGIYSTSSWWAQIAGVVKASSSLYRLTEWRAGASSKSQAASYCNMAPLTPAGKITLTQYSSGSVDNDLPCI